MLLRLIDKPEENGHIEIILQTESETLSFSTEYFPSPYSHAFQQTLDWYFARYPQQVLKEFNDRDVVNKVVNLGRHMGDRLLGEDHELIKITEIIEDQGFNELSVQIESNRFEFFEEQWEAIVLPESSYILSSVSKSFNRVFTAGDSMSSELNFELNKESPLGILHIISRSDQAAGQSSINHIFGRCVDMLEFDGAIHYEAFPSDNREALLKRLKDSEQPVHIIHYNGPISFTEAGPLLILSKQGDHTQTISVEQLAGAFQSSKPGLLSIEASHFSQQNSALCCELALAWIAQTAQQQGIASVLGLSHITDPWHSSLCFKTVYQKIAQGLELSQAVVEARKQLQALVESSEFRAKPIPFQSWSLIRLYSNKTVNFFATMQQQQTLLEVPAYGHIRQRLHGFRSEYLPPHMKTAADGIFTGALALCRSHSCLMITGIEGSGKTHSCHQLAFHLADKSAVNESEKSSHSFYFDYNVHFYSKYDILSMIAPIFSVTETDRELLQEKVQDKLLQSPSTFVFDNLATDICNHDNGKIEKSLSILMTFIQNLLQQDSHTLIITGTGHHQIESDLIEAGAVALAIKPLDQSEQKILASDCLRQYGLDEKDQDEEFTRLLNCLQGNPFLLSRLPAALESKSYQDLTTAVTSWFDDKQQARLLDSFYQWQWDQLPVIWQRWLLLLAELPEVLLEMLASVCDHTNKYEPAKQLLTILGDEKAVFSKGIKLMDHAGFTLNYSHGKTIHPRCIEFLQSKHQQDSLFSSKATEIDLLMSMIVCESLCRVIPYIQQQPNPVITQNIMMNRGLWAKHLEKLWFGKQYSAFMATLSQLDTLLKQHKIPQEIPAWAADLLLRAGSPPTPDEQELSNLVAYLTVAVHALQQSQMPPQGAEQDNSKLKECLKATAALWFKWLMNLNSDSVKENSALFYHSLQFLDGYYRCEKMWQELCGISELACKEYKNHKVWPRLIPHLHTLADCYFELGESEKGLDCEKELLDEIPLKDMPPGVKSQIGIRIIVNRIHRADTDNAQLTLDQLREEPDTGNLTTPLDTLQADLYFACDKLEQAADLYKELQERIKEQQGQDQGGTGEYLQMQLDKIKSKL